MKENVARFYELLAKDAALQKRIEELNAEYAGKDLSESQLRRVLGQELIPLAEKAGLPFTIEELMEFGRGAGGDDSRAIADDELEAVAGGDACVCTFGGGGRASEDPSGEEACGCILGGGGQRPGQRRSRSPEKPCGCVLAGGGGATDGEGGRITRCWCVAYGEGCGVEPMPAGPMGTGSRRRP